MEDKEEKTLLKATVCIPIINREILLGVKTRKIGVGCWNGFGGGVEEGETILECAIRELEEESCLKAEIEDLEKVAIVNFHNEKSDGTIFISQVHFFLVKNWERDPVETKDGAMITPTFFNIDNLPIKKMMPADKEFFELILKGGKFIIEAHYSPFQKELKGKVKIIKVDQLPED